ncbi:F-box only protein 47 [Sarcoptes scabiei]|uniref:F-box only protein 47 n=1 Tax=Sarcoptes scabiei TaxID=52283 RepID=A0A834VAG4_SARSC|nr:F-box only protein 47 [Sarcoptes scabiei]
MIFGFNENKRKLIEINNRLDVDDNSITIKKVNSMKLSTSFFTFIKDNMARRVHGDHNSRLQEETIGLFNRLPVELFMKILQYLSTEDLSNMALVNLQIRNFIIENFLINSNGFLHLIRSSQAIGDFSDDLLSRKILNLFVSVGLLLKRCTFLFRTSERICFLIHIMEESYGIPSIKSLSVYNFPCFKLIIKFYGAILNIFINGWGDFECNNVFQTLKDIAQIDLQIQKFLNSSLGSKQKHELLIRMFFRMICSYQNENIENFKEKMDWLIKTLNVYSVQEISKLLIVIFGPLVTINNSSYSLPYLAWWDLTDSNFMEKGLENLGLTFHYIYKNSDEFLWSKDYIIQILECVISTPNFWTNVNVSILLFYVGFDVSLKFLAKKMKDGYVMTVANYLCYLNIITFKNTQDLSSVLQLIDCLLEEFGDELIEEMTNSFSTAIFDLNIENNDEDDPDFVDHFEVIESQLELMKLSLLRHSCFKKYL